MNPHLKLILEVDTAVTCGAQGFAQIASDCRVIQFAGEAEAADLWKLSTSSGKTLQAKVQTPAEYAEKHIGYSDGCHTVDALYLHRMDITCQVTGLTCRAIAISNRWSNGEIHEDAFAILHCPDIPYNGSKAWGIDLSNKIHKHILRENEKRVENLCDLALGGLKKKITEQEAA